MIFVDLNLTMNVGDRYMVSWGSKSCEIAIFYVVSEVFSENKKAWHFSATRRWFKGPVSIFLLQMLKLNLLFVWRGRSMLFQLLLRVLRVAWTWPFVCSSKFANTSLPAMFFAFKQIFSILSLEYRKDMYLNLLVLIFGLQIPFHVSKLALFKDF
jgi:hypothetical protein